MSKDKHTPTKSDEAQRVVQRGDRLAQGSRSGHDRRGADRGLDAGRRRIDHREVRSAFLMRVKDMQIMGMSASSIAMVLNDEGVTTAQGQKWSAIAIKQLLGVSERIERKNAWSPLKATQSDRDSKQPADD
ncbi:MAG: hypothetical protein VX589_03140 [Myxococcota bacterium]|nr:hypothetical protein [Myxococcota bacterium]